MITFSKTEVDKFFKNKHLKYGQELTIPNNQTGNIMKIKVCIENREKIENLLKEVNGIAKEHTFTSFMEVYNIVCKSENKLSESGIPKKDRKGVVIAARSGGNKKPSSYKYKRKVNYLGIERGDDHWFITSVWSATTYPDEAGFVDVFLTPDQKKKAIDNFLASFFNI